MRNDYDTMLKKKKKKKLLYHDSVWENIKKNIYI